MFQEHQLVGLDFETYSDVDLPKRGLENYVRSPFFQPLLGRAVFRDRGNVRELRCDFTAQIGLKESLRHFISDRFIVAHNAAFEKRVLAQLGLHYPSGRFVDSAAIARAAGAGGKLEAAGPQLLGIDKLDVGTRLIKLFSVPGKYQEETGTSDFDERIVENNLQDWKLFDEYCGVDAQIGLDLALQFGWVFTNPELHYDSLTIDMNEMGWPVDVELVKEMQRRYEDNLASQLESFRSQTGATELNLNSLKQMKEWCADRGIKANSFAEKPVEALLKRLSAKIATMSSDDPKFHGYCEVQLLLQTKQALGGSSLKKLQVILDNVCNGRLYDQYLHIGASQTWRTSGKTVQMQNLKRLGEIGDMSELDDPDILWDNEELASNVRQVFTSSDPNGRLIVGDFSSVEARGLAYLAGEDWKLDAFRQGKDMYKVGASRQFGVAYDAVTKPQRTFGKVGELACGYQSGPGAVRDFAAKMDVVLSEGEATSLVNNWRETNPDIVALWYRLDDMLHEIIDGAQWTSYQFPYDGLRLQMQTKPAPESLRRQAGPNLQTLEILLYDRSSTVIMRRFFHGIYLRGRNICYFKPSERKTGDLWKPGYVDPKTKVYRHYDVYGGKLAGILTQSFCREIFFHVLARVQNWVDTYNHIEIIGQFHDEMVLDWRPGSSLDLDMTMWRLKTDMSNNVPFAGFPLAAEVKCDYRYTK